MKRTKFYVYDHSTKTILGKNLTRKEAEKIMRECPNKDHTRMYPMFPELC